MLTVVRLVGAAVQSNDLVFILLTGGGLALLGTVLGALITQTFTIRFGRETRREEHRLAIKAFQRDTLVALQNEAVELRTLENVAWGDDDAGLDDAALRAYWAAASRLRMLASRVRDEQLRSAVLSLLESEDEFLESVRRGEIPPASVSSGITEAMRSIYDRAGELIRTLDELDEAALG